jgi:hypothetical protein
VLHGYGAPFLVFFLPTEPAGCEELTKGVFNWWRAPKQDAWWQGSSFNLRRQWGKAPRDGSREGWQNGATQDVEH